MNTYTYDELYDRASTFPMFPVHGTPQEQEAFSIKCANSILRMRATAKACIDNKMYTKKITGLVQEFVPKVALKCQAVNLNNSQCKFKATCGKFCKKHQVSVEMLKMLE